MAEVIRMPRMSDTMTEGVIVQWLKKTGESVKIGDVLAEVETDKATMDLESPADGTLLHIGVEAGQAVPIDGVIAVIGKEGEEFQSLLGGAAPAAAAAPAPAPSAAAPSAAPAAAAPPASEQPAVAAATAAAPAPAAQQQAAPAEQQAAPAPAGEEGRMKASPLAKRMAEEKGIPLNQVQGSGDSGRIVRRDVENFQPKAQPAPQAAQTAPIMATPAGVEGFEDVNISQMRKTIARRLAESKFSAPHFYLTIEINMGRAIQARKAINDYLGSKVSFNDMVIRAAAAALRRHPKINGSWLGDKIRYYQHIHIGVAMAVEDGLVVPVVRFADTKGLSQISQEVKQYAEKSKIKKLQPQDFEGNTFTISNLGMFGIEEFTAIINPPDACILAVGGIQEKAIVENGEIRIGSMMKVTLSCDHRIVDGASGAQFLQTLKQFLEEPATILA